MDTNKPKIVALYHYMYPDDVSSARYFDNFCEELVSRGWQVEAMPCNRGWQDETQKFPAHMEHHGVQLNRIWRPAFKQASSLGRIMNSIWMIAGWSGIAFRRRRNLPDMIVVGTDPVFGLVAGLIIKTLRPRVRLTHWCLDVYPEAAIAHGMIRANSTVLRLIKTVMGAAYRSCDFIVDLGSCMRRLIDPYRPTCRLASLTTWALHEPDQPATVDKAAREELFGDTALGLLYSGNFGRANSFEGILELARMLRGERIGFCFSVRGNSEQELRAAVAPEDTNIRFAGFAPESELGKRLGAADIHMVSLRPEWTGISIPSKFYGCLAVGRPVIYAGARDSLIAELITQHKVGWVLDKDSLESVAAELRSFAADRSKLLALQRHCFEIYQTHFSKKLVMNEWDRQLRDILKK